MRVFTLSFLIVVGVLGVAGGALAMVGLARWGAAGWYYHYDPEYRLLCGQQALHKGDAGRAKEIALILEADGYRDQACLLRGEEMFLQGKSYAEANKPEVAAPMLSKALGELFKIRDKGALLLKASVIIGECHLYLRQFHEAEGAFTFVVDNDEQNADAHRGLASIYHDQGAMSRAIFHLEKVAELDPSDGRPYRLMGLIYKDQEQYDQAIENYEKALERRLPPRVRNLDPDVVRKELVECLVRRAHYGQALEALEQLNPLPDDAAAVEALRAESLIGLDRRSEARAVLDEAMRIYSNNGDLFRLRAQLHLEASEFEQARAGLDRALLIDSNDYRSRYLLIQVLQSLGRLQEVKEEQLKLDQLKKNLDERTWLTQEAVNKPWDASIRLRLAELCEKLVRPDLGIMWRQAAAACPPSPIQEKKREKAKSGN